MSTVFVAPLQLHRVEVHPTVIMLIMLKCLPCIDTNLLDMSTYKPRLVPVHAPDRVPVRLAANLTLQT